MSSRISHVANPATTASHHPIPKKPPHKKTPTSPPSLEHIQSVATASLLSTESIREMLRPYLDSNENYGIALGEVLEHGIPKMEPERLSAIISELITNCETLFYTTLHISLWSNSFFEALECLIPSIETHGCIPSLRKLGALNNSKKHGLSSFLYRSNTDHPCSTIFLHCNEPTWSTTVKLFTDKLLFVTRTLKTHPGKKPPLHSVPYKMMLSYQRSEVITETVSV
ncbi:hypothetical protein DID78_06660 [Candidatus Marinamargulisbacteria bacterium SCGC AG-343-D04]|nr:hypothetical protein DID78_06660 [Candidatus Marinamargulisbacteria bacterium SCGC AG-343-D04]